MNSMTIAVLLCLVAAAYAHAQPLNSFDEVADAAAPEADYYPEDSPVRTKRSLILLKKKLLLGALGLKAAKVGAVGLGALALKKKSVKPKVTEVHHSYGFQG